MFKKLKDKLAEEVKSSPQRIQQFAQAAQAAVTSASSSISDITNNDLFSIGDNDNQQARTVKTNTLSSNQPSNVQDISLVQPMSLQTSSESMDYAPSQDIIENQRQRRLSNSSFASDVSFRLPSYESPSMYHLQSDMDVSASEAEERSISGNAVSLDRVTKEQLYSAYRRTQERYAKYRTQYADLARHYKLLERENAKARSVLVETQDKALRRISELREQCALEQGAKAHLEKSLRVEIEERNMKIEALTTKINLLQSNTEILQENPKVVETNENPLIDLSHTCDTENTNTHQSATSEINILNNKIEKLEQLVNKYKDSLKASKDKNTQLATELQKISSELEKQQQENAEAITNITLLAQAKEKIQELNQANEELQNKVNTNDFNKMKEISTLEMDLKAAQEELDQLRNKIEIFSKREEEYAISLAENKLSIHKELESKESEIKSLKESLSVCKKEVQSLNIVLNDLKKNTILLEDEKSKLKNDIENLHSSKNRISEVESEIQQLMSKYQALEQSKIKSDEENQCLQLQLKQETAEKLAMIDRNAYLEKRNTQLMEEIRKKMSQLTKLEKEIQALKKDAADHEADASEKSKMIEEIDTWKTKYSSLESEIQEERVELVKLQSEIEKLLANYELLQSNNLDLQLSLTELKSENTSLQHEVAKKDKLQTVISGLHNKLKNLQRLVADTHRDLQSLKEVNSKTFTIVNENLKLISNNLAKSSATDIIKSKYENLKIEHDVAKAEIQMLSDKHKSVLLEVTTLKKENNELLSKIHLNEKECDNLRMKYQEMHALYESSLHDLELLNENKEVLMSRVKTMESKCKDLEDEINNGGDQSLLASATDTIKSLETEKTAFSEKLNKIKNENQSLLNEIKELEIQYKREIEKMSKLSKENDELNREIHKSKSDALYIKQLEENIEAFKTENTCLKHQMESINQNIKDLESEVNDVRQKHSLIEVEKDHLNFVIQKMEQREKQVMSNENNKCVQTETSEDVEKLAYMTSLEIANAELVEEVRNLKEGNFVFTQKLENLSAKMIKDSENYNALKNEHDLLKDENRRLQSEFEGIQTYLTKISKDNCILNDKLRESIASGESVTEKVNNKSEDEKIDELLRENTLLVEENLELKDQLDLQNSVKNTVVENEKKRDFVSLKEEYNNLLEVKNKLEKKLSDLELMNKSADGSMEQLQEHNEKLRLSNEKLERRLDEALVRLRHLHSLQELQENTELEYLRNILYEYLTGSGTHSVTLAKVLAAVVKFDDTQTQLILQKEKERQGLLRQLGLL